MSARDPYVEARELKGRWLSMRYMVLRRLAQGVFLLVFLTGPWIGWWIAKGTLASSRTFNVLPLTDPYVLLQSLVARHWPEGTAIIGALIVLAAYLALGGRTYCSWVCPINPITDLAASARRRLGVKQTAKLRPELRNYLAVAVLIVSALSGTIAWELVNPITALHRALVFGLPFAATGALAIFVFDLFVAKDGWCGHICPVGAFYGALGKVTLLRVAANNRVACDDCMDCFEVCPEPHVITPALRGDKTGASPIIFSGDCTLCGACVDVCPREVYRITHRFDHRTTPRDAGADPAIPAVPVSTLAKG